MAQTESETERVPVDVLVRVYVKIRDAREALAAKYEESDGDLKGQLDVIKQQLLDTCKELGVDSLKTGVGTVSRTVKTRYWSSDWGAMHDFVKEHNALDLLERRVHQGNMKTFLQENPEVKVPALNSDSAYDVTVRRK